MIISQSRKKRIFDRIRLLFGGAPCREQAAALPWRLGENGIEIMLVTSRGTGRWVLPKGWPEGREEFWQAAAREAGEEAGISGAISQRQIGAFYYGKELPQGMEWRCQVHVYSLEVDQIAEKWPERRKRKREWFSPAEACSKVREADLSELIAGFSVNPRQLAA